MREDIFKIKSVKAREILDSRGNPTVEVDVSTVSGFGRAAVHSGVSTGTHEAVELRDGDSRRYGGLGVLKAVNNVNKIISKSVVGMDCRMQKEIDDLMIKLDGTENKGKLGANSILGVSLACARAAANCLGVPLYSYLGRAKANKLPVPMMNIINGGKHAGGNLKIQEFMILPMRANSFSEALSMGAETYQALKGILKKRYGVSAINVGDEGGFAPPLDTTAQALDSIMQAIGQAGYKAGKDIYLGIDAAASGLYDKASKRYEVDGEKLDVSAMIDYYKNLCKTYPLITIEDPFEEEQFEAFAQFTRGMGKKVQIVGDDLFVTNVKRLQKGISMGACNALLLKVNQIGSLSESIAAAELAQKNGYRVIVSHRSGETEDTTIADLAVGFGAQMIKAGATARGERIAKYNQLLRIEEMLGEAAEYWGPRLIA